MNKQWEINNKALEAVFARAAAKDERIRKLLVKKAEPKVKSCLGFTFDRTYDDEVLDKSYASVGGFLSKKGFERLGAGMYSTVYGKPGQDRVIKVLHNPAGDAWLPYVKWANAQDSKFAPKLYSYKYSKKHGVGLAVMERLEKTARQFESQEEIAVVPTLINFVSQGNPTAEVLVDLVQPGIVPFFKDLKATFSEARLDLHGGNWMSRKDGSIVLSDPLCGYVSASKYLERWRPTLSQALRRSV